MKIVGCPDIEIAFADFPTGRYTPIAMTIMCTISMIALVLPGRKLVSKAKSPAEQNVSLQNNSNSILIIRKFVFDIMDQHLRIGDEIISLTDKGCRILTLLNKNIGGLTLRENLIQEVWTDESVITWRSFDMFISKLRKKISGDPELRITNVHDKGYRLEIVNDTIPD